MSPSYRVDYPVDLGAAHARANKFCEIHLTIWDDGGRRPVRRSVTFTAASVGWQTTVKVIPKLIEGSSSGHRLIKFET